jgi:hypothetical protein
MKWCEWLVMRGAQRSVGGADDLGGADSKFLRLNRTFGWKTRDLPTFVQVRQRYVLGFQGGLKRCS